MQIYCIYALSVCLLGWCAYSLFCMVLIFKILNNVIEKVNAVFGKCGNTQSLQQPATKWKHHCRQRAGSYKPQTDSFSLIYNFAFLHIKINGQKVMFSIFFKWVVMGPSGLLMASASTLKDALVTTSRLYGATNLQKEKSKLHDCCWCMRYAIVA